LVGESKRDQHFAKAKETKKQELEFRVSKKYIIRFISK
jgi:hypothetical protein